MRDGFIIHDRTLNQLDMLDVEDQAYLLRCMRTFYQDGEIDLESVAETSQAVAVIMVDVMERMTSDAAAYEKQLEQRRRAAEKRWEKEKSHSDGMRDDATAYERNADNADDGYDAVSVSVNNKRERRFTPPSPTDVREYCDEGGYTNVDVNAFVDFYTAKGWKVGSQPMKDWKAAVRSWNRREEKAKKPPDRKTAFHNFPQRSDPGSKDLVQQLIAAQQ